jgi:hypothetical protein
MSVNTQVLLLKKVATKDGFLDEVGSVYVSVLNRVHATHVTFCLQAKAI